MSFVSRNSLKYSSSYLFVNRLVFCQSSTKNIFLFSAPLELQNITNSMLSIIHLFVLFVLGLLMIVMIIRLSKEFTSKQLSGI